MGMLGHWPGTTISNGSTSSIKFDSKSRTHRWKTYFFKHKGEVEANVANIKT